MAKEKAKSKLKAEAKAKTKSRSKPDSKSARTLRAFLVGASPAQTAEHTRATLQRLKADTATDLLIGVDAGTQTLLDAGYRPHMAVGDWDSFTGPEARRQLAGIHHLTLPVDKDRTDLFYAAQVAINAEATELHCLGVTGGRPDQHLATLLDLSAITAGESGEGAGAGGDGASAAHALTRVSAYAPEGDYHFLSAMIPRWREAFPAPRTVSVFALHGVARGVTLKGFKYPLKDGEMEPSSHGLSNRTWSPVCEIQLGEGQLVVIVPSEQLGLGSGPKD